MGEVVIRTPAGTYYLDSWEHVFSLRVCGSDGSINHELYIKHQKLVRDGELDNFIWMRDVEHNHSEGIKCITRQWIERGHYIFVPELT